MLVRLGEFKRWWFCVESMDGSDNGSVLRLRNDDGHPAQLRCVTPVSGVEFGRKRRESGSVVGAAASVRARGGGESPGDGVKRVWKIAKRVKRENSSSGDDDSAVHGRIVEAVLRGEAAEEAGTHRIDARVESWGSKGMPEREQLKSRVRPWRFMYFEKGEWVEYCEEANSAAWSSFLAGCVTAEITVANRVYLLNFSDMTQVNVATGYVRSIAWIGDAWEVSLPSNPFASPSEKSLGVLRLGNRFIRHRTTSWRDGATDTIASLMLGPDEARGCALPVERNDAGNAPDDDFGRTGGQEGVCISIDASGDYELTKLRLGGYSGVTCLSEPTEAKPAVVAVLEEKSANFGKSSGFSSTLGQRFVKLEDGSKESDDIKRKFLSGFGKLGDASMITGIHRDCSSIALIRQEAFERQKALTEHTRGDANVRYGWHGTSKKGVAGIFLHGFGQPKTPKNGSAYGVGVYLAVENQAFVSALYADNDENGEQHVVLCQVITGASELVKPPSEQFHPSSEHFDTGVDDLLAPKRLIVWSTHMNTHILPLYVVSFKLPPRWHRMMAELNGKHKGFSMFCHEVSVKRPYFTKQTCGMTEALRNKPIGCANHHQQGPTSAFIRFPHLFGFLQRLLNPEQRLVLKNCYTKFEAGSMDRRTFVQEIQKMVGRDCLIRAIQMCQGFQGCKGTSVIEAQ